jgi:branched-chain amino acid transport system substrate-binding protein
MSLTGPGELDWTPVKRALDLLPKQAGGRAVEYHFADDQADPAQAVREAERLINELGVHAIAHFSLSGPAIAVAATARDHALMHFVLSPIELNPGEDAWTFRLSPRAALMADALMNRIRASGIRRVAYVGTNDNYGNSWRRLITSLGSAFGVQIAAEAAYARGDTSLEGAAAVTNAAPECVIIGGPGNTAPMPHRALRESGFDGLIFHTFGADMRALASQPRHLFDGTLMVTGPGSLAEAVPADSPCRAEIDSYERAYSDLHGERPVSQAAISVWDFKRIVEAAASKLDPAKPASRQGLKEALLSCGAITAGSGVFRYGDSDHFGLGEEARIIVQLQDGVWRPV